MSTDEPKIQPKLTITMSAKHPGHQGGRIHPQQQETNDGALTIGCDLVAPADLAARYIETITHSLSIHARKDYRYRIKRIIDFLGTARQ